MDDERFMSVSASHEIPRSLGFAQDRLGRPQPNLSPRATPTILERFRAMLRSREDELRDDGDYDTPPPPDGDEIVGMFSELLSDLTFNSKPIITELTIIAGDQREHARGIVEAVCDRIDEVPQDQKLPALYLLDSIVKNIGDEYVRYFAARLPKAYNDVHSSLHAAMHRLFRTWSQVFPHSVLNKIKDELKFPSPENQRPSDLLGIQTSDSPHPSHGIHVNPKYLEARHHIEDPADILHSAEVPSGIQAPDHKSFTKYGDHNLDHLGFQSSNLKMVKEGSPQTLHGSSMAGQEGTFFSSQRKVATRLSPTRFELRRSASPQVQRFKRSSPGQMVEVPSRCYSELEFQSDRSSENNGWFGRSMSIDDGGQQPVALTAYSMHGRQRQRDLIDAYGNYRGKSSIYESYHKIPRVNINGLKGESRKMDWQNSEEEEYVWEDMSPTLGDLSKRNSIQSEPSSGKLELINSNRPGIIAQKSDFRRRSWPAPPIKDTTSTIDDRIEIQDYNHGPMNRMHADDSGSTIEPFRHYAKSHVSEEIAPIPWDKHGSLPHTFHHPMRDNLSPKSQGRPFQLPYFVNGATPSVTHKWHSSYDNTHPTEVPFLKFSASPDPLNLEMQTIASQKAHQPPFAPTWAPQPHKSQPLQLLPTPNLQVNNNKPLGNQQLNFSLPLSLQQGDANGKKILRHPLLETRGGFIQPTPAQTAANFTQPLINLQPLGQNSILELPNHISGTTISAVQNIPMPPLPPGPPPLLSQPLPTSQNNSSATSNSSVSGFSGLISSLMAQGLISLIPPAQSQTTVGLEFNADLLKIRHESAINAMYSELPRQCTTCGLRFTCQEDHSSHMDWHVTKNRISKNRKQNSSRKWFVSAKEWLCGAETLGADVVPGFLPTETVPDRKKEREIAVPADENQTACALCGEPFEDFYSDETEEWMYRGAVYLNSPNWDIEGLDRSQLGPIVHVKCRSESSEGSGLA